MGLKVIGICGLCRSGKDTVASLIKQHKPGTTILSLATPLKEQVAKSLNISVEELEMRKNEDPNTRQILIDVGQRARQEDKDFWINKLLERFPSEGFIAVPDVRFRNEHITVSGWAKKHNGDYELWNVVGPWHSQQALDMANTEALSLKLIANRTILNVVLNPGNEGYLPYQELSALVKKELL